ncbi:PorZ beta-propeller-like domain-containing protein [Dyadobacter frigoris]|uniref:PorZ N-terminal beta-propeller domain-containing protein n=1 Tax=Dyadobacter frigoris TaxID=2576211 RepID=A0A4U6D7L0_9BACT|nr:two-component regulator propeller domain-containing protein [Dyadobacter frigoris]TKT93430.1 hypothetical protein FDK13_06150 [Dyadobacter frigoris]GLU55847.1 hypothetical protein Dfri01_53080 [Dyadobacter frigoris]
MRNFTLLLLWGMLTSAVHAQNVPLGTWESHFSYRSAKHILKVRNKIFCSSYNGLFRIDPANDEISNYSKANGLSEVGISSMAYDSTENLIILAYRSGNLDLLYLNKNLEPDQIINWPFLADASDLPANKQISKISFQNNKVYLSTNFGIIVLDPKLRKIEETYRYIGPGGLEVSVTDITFSSDSLFAATSQGLLSTSLSSTVNKQYFANWKIVPTPYKAISVSYQNGNINAGFSGHGVYKRNNAPWELIYESTSQTYSFSDKNNLVTLSDRILVLNQNKTDVYQNPIFNALQESLRVNSYFWSADSKQGLLSNKDGAFRSYSPADADTTISPRTDSTIIDLNGLAWSRLPDYLGGGISIKNIQTNKQRILSTSIGNGGLPSSLVHSLTIDTDGYIWFASERGVGYFIPDDILSGSAVNAILPVYGQRKLFSSERSNAISVEPGNRKWIGTDNGLFQFTADGTELIKQFTASDSPLPSSKISALNFEGATGLLFVDTPNGMVSYRSDASTPNENLSTITVFPNPVRPNFDGVLGVKGLMDNSTVKFTDLSGRLVYETRSQGGTASWDLNDYTGKRVRGGIYLIIIVSSDRSEKMAGKLAVIN